MAHQIWKKLSRNILNASIEICVSIWIEFVLHMLSKHRHWLQTYSPMRYVYLVTLVHWGLYTSIPSKNVRHKNQTVFRLLILGQHFLENRAKAISNTDAILKAILEAGAMFLPIIVQDKGSFTWLSRVNGVITANDMTIISINLAIHLLTGNLFHKIPSAVNATLSELYITLCWVGFTEKCCWCTLGSVVMNGHTLWWKTCWLTKESS